MKLFYASNGFVGNGYVHAYVIASDDGQALKMAVEHFRKNAGIHSRDKKYWEQVEVHEECSDTSQSWAGPISD